jgi:hypothetical protein
VYSLFYVRNKGYAQLSHPNCIMRSEWRQDHGKNICSFSEGCGALARAAVQRTSVGAAPSSLVAVLNDASQVFCFLAHLHCPKRLLRGVWTLKGRGGGRIAKREGWHCRAGHHDFVLILFFSCAVRGSSHVFFFFSTSLSREKQNTVTLSFDLNKKQHTLSLILVHSRMQTHTHTKTTSPLLISFLR